MSINLKKKRSDYSNSYVIHTAILRIDFDIAANRHWIINWFFRNYIKFISYTYADFKNRDVLYNTSIKHMTSSWIIEKEEEPEYRLYFLRNNTVYIERINDE